MPAPANPHKRPQKSVWQLAASSVKLTSSVIWHTAAKLSKQQNMLMEPLQGGGGEGGEVRTLHRP